MLGDTSTLAFLIIAALCLLTGLMAGWVLMGTISQRHLEALHRALVVAWRRADREGLSFGCVPDDTESGGAVVDTLLQKWTWHEWLAWAAAEDGRLLREAAAAAGEAEERSPHGRPPASRPVLFAGRSAGRRRGDKRQ